MIIPVVITAPEIEPVTLDDVKAHSRIDTDADDPWLQVSIKAARELLEGYLARKLISQTVRWSIPHVGSVMCLPYPNVSSVTVKYYDTDGDLQTVATTVYRVLNSNDPANECALEVLSGQVWPSPDTRVLPWVIDIACGYGSTADTVPESVRLALKMLVGQWYENRETIVTGASVADLPFTVKALVAAHKWRPAT